MAEAIVDLEGLDFRKLSESSRSKPGSNSDRESGLIMNAWLGNYCNHEGGYDVWKKISQRYLK